MNTRLKNNHLILLSCICGFSLSQSTLAPSCAAGTADSKTVVGSKKEVGTGEVIPAYNPKTLHRFDFRVVGKSCATCLHHMQDRMKEVPGVLKVAVMLQKPYGAVVIYDASKTTQEKILEKSSEGLTDVDYEDKSDQVIKAIPIVLVPATASKKEADGAK